MTINGVSLTELITALTGQYGVLALLILIFYAGYKKWWVFGWYAKELADRNDKIERRLDRAIGAAESGTSLARDVRKEVHSE